PAARLQTARDEEIHQEADHLAAGVAVDFQGRRSNCKDDLVRDVGAEAPEPESALRGRFGKRLAGAGAEEAAQGGPGLGVVQSEGGDGRLAGRRQTGYPGLAHGRASAVRRMPSRVIDGQTAAGGRTVARRGASPPVRKTRGSALAVRA